MWGHTLCAFQHFSSPPFSMWWCVVVDHYYFRCVKSSTGDCEKIHRVTESSSTKNHNLYAPRDDGSPSTAYIMGATNHLDEINNHIQPLSLEKQQQKQQQISRKVLNEQVVRDKAHHFPCIRLSTISNSICTILVYSGTPRTPTNGDDLQLH